MPEDDHPGQCSSADHNSSRLFVLCPNCGSLNTQSLCRAQRIGGVLGACVGAVGAVSGPLAGAANGARLGAGAAAVIAGPAAPVAVLPSAIVGALAGAAVGCAAGAALGHTIDELVLNNRRCLSCSHTFQA